MRVAVYCASSDDAHHTYREDAAALGTAIGVGGHQLVYGGGNIGSMGALA
ncbi:MAG: TIGR00730 family Rossman fold protein, partial [Planctomycetes bacterium]|nr:TIGR00730 family Rossman fold protein [Planctomycetota bacterium]